MDGQPAPIGDVGSVAFDVTDRLAIINLFGAYAYTDDENRLDEFRTLFTDSPELVLLHEGRALSADIETVMSLLAVRKAGFKAENNQWRHALNSYWFSAKRPAKRPDTAMCRYSPSKTAARPSRI
jgi:hypothetical protein